MSYVFMLWNYVSSFFKSNSPKISESHNIRFYGNCNSTDEQINIKRQNVSGIITYYNENTKNGRIDGYIDFNGLTNTTYDIPTHKIMVGAEVIVDLVRNAKLSPWVVTHMIVTSMPDKADSDWEDDIKIDQNVKSNPSDILPTKQVGMITSSFNGDIILNDKIKFRQKDCGNNSFLVQKGDWVIIEFDHSIRENKVIGMHPLRYIDYEGTVSAYNGNTGYVDRMIFFNRNATKNQNLRRGMLVYGTAIESVQGRQCNFRALTIFLTNKNDSNSKLLMKVKTIDSQFSDVVEPEDVGLTLSQKFIDFDKVLINNTSIKKVIIQNTDCSLVHITNFKFTNEINDQFIVCNDVNNEILEKDQIFEICIKCKPQFPGFDSQKLIIEFERDNKTNRIMIDVSVYSVDPSSSEYNDETNVRTEETKSNVRPSSSKVSGIYLPVAKPLSIRSTMTKMYPHKLKSYEIPSELERLVGIKEELYANYPILNEKLDPGSYFTKMNLMIHLEEINTKKEMEQFIMDDVRMLPRRETFAIEVPGLTEGRPSLMVGDKVIVELKCPGQPVYSGTIEEIMANSIFAKFHPTLHSTYTNELSIVSFQHSRLSYRRMHQGVDMACSNLGDTLLFPSFIKKKSSQCIRLSRNGLNELSAANFVKDSLNSLQLKFYNCSLNELQKVAVVRILHGYTRPLPYILFGPPGTGKTVTLVEAILQVFKNVASSRILLCAPSNSAADLLCLRLHETGIVQTGEMVRMNAHRRTILSETSDKEPIPPKIIPYCKSVDELPDIAMYRIIISTCVTSGALYQLGLKSGHITHVFVDEAGQASEPEIMIALGFIAPISGQIVLAGDPMQLGPVVRSKYTQKTLTESYLHRLLLSCPLYSPQAEICPGSTTHFNPLVITQLLQNYRAHPHLLKLPSDLFYSSTLISAVDISETEMFLEWQHLPNPQFPMVFQGVRGKEMRNDKNPSTYNPCEAVTVARWIGRLLQFAEERSSSSSGARVFDCSKISVITPYRAQVDCIRKMIENCLDKAVVNLAKLKVGSVEEFQGQENQVVIISTVRSSVDSHENQETASIMSLISERLSFLSNKRRFNVSITRACSLLIVIGDPVLLRYDDNWASLIEYAKQNKAYCGAV